MIFSCTSIQNITKKMLHTNVMYRISFVNFLFENSLFINFLKKKFQIIKKEL